MKDPAVLFYTSDFLTGTMTLTDEQTGKYIRLLCLQHQKGKLLEKDMLYICKTYDEDIFSKFTKDESGCYYNKRMSDEAAKRKLYSESRRDNRKKKDMSNISKSYVKHMENENAIEDIDTDIDTDEIKNAKKRFKPPEIEEVQEYCQQRGGIVDSDKFFDFYTSKGWMVGKNKMKDWKACVRTWEKDSKPKEDSGGYFIKKAMEGRKND